MRSGRFAILKMLRCLRGSTSLLKLRSPMRGLPKAKTVTQESLSPRLVVVLSHSLWINSVADRIDRTAPIWPVKMMLTSSYLYNSSDLFSPWTWKPRQRHTNGKISKKPKEIGDVTDRNVDKGRPLLSVYRHVIMGWIYIYEMKII